MFKTLQIFVFIFDKCFSHVLTENEITSEDAEINDSLIEDATMKKTVNQGPCQLRTPGSQPPLFKVAAR